MAEFTLLWADETDTGDDHYVVKGPEGIGHVVYIDGVEPWVSHGCLPHHLRVGDGEAVRGKPGRRSLDAIASRWSPMADVSPTVRIAELMESIEDRRRRRRNRAALAARGWGHVI